MVALKAQQASVCVNLGLLLSQLSPHHNRRKQPCDRIPHGGVFLEMILLNLASSTKSSAVTYLGHHYYHTVATLEIKLPVSKGAFVLVKFPLIINSEITRNFLQNDLSVWKHKHKWLVTQWSTVALTK